MIELVIVVSLGLIVAGIVGPNIATVQSKMDTQNSRDALIVLSSYARAAAVERGARVDLNVDGEAGLATVTSGGETLRKVDFAEEYGTSVAVAGATGVVTVCYSARGFAFSSCTYGQLPLNVTFRGRGESALARMRPLGQIDRL